MSRKRRSAPLDAPESFDALETGRLTWLGFALAGIGWTMLIGEATIADVLSGRAARSPVFHADLVDIAKCVIASGFAIAVIGALQTGFGALNRFFEAVLMRSAHRTSTPLAEAAPTPRASEPETAPRSGGKRPYRILADGTVEVETIVGTRKFRSLAEAREFL